MERQPIASQAILSAGWEAEGDFGTGYMEVEWANHKVYAASDVPEADWLAFYGSPSPGRYYHSVLKESYAWVEI